jgi:flagellar basal body-associated protein FliL
MEPVLFQRHRVIATIVILALFALAVATAVFRISTLEEAETAARQQAAAHEAAQLKADFEANKASIAAAIRADIAGGRLEEADALLRKYRPVADGALDALVNSQPPSSK